LLELRAIHATTHHVAQYFFTLDAAVDLYGRACSMVDEHDCYFGVCPRVRPEGTKDAVTVAPGLWCDLDFKRFPGGEAEALVAVNAFTPAPDWIIGTGGGFHLYWQLAIPAPADARFEAKLKGLVRAIKADPAATDRSRVLRIPGTWHQRRNYQVRIVRWPTN
jgi:putative DNA primase/helicase